jgi:hypothetical protein
MSIHTIPHAAPQGLRPGRSGVPAAMLGALAAGLLALPGQARADSYGHAEISLGFPHGAVTVGRTWDEHPRQVVVEEVTHKYPEADDEADVDEDDDDAAYDNRSDDPDVVIERHIVRPAPRQVTIIEHYEDPEPCERVHVVRRVYVDRPECDRRDVVYYGRPTVHVMHGGPTVIVAPGGRGWHGGGFRGGRGWHTGYREEGPRNLFPENGGRPARERGVSRSLVQVGVHSH